MYVISLVNVAMENLFSFSSFYFLFAILNLISLIGHPSIQLCFMDPSQNKKPANHN